MILAALEEIHLRGLRFTMGDLTRRLRMSKSSLYKIVASKDALVHAVVDYIIREFNRRERELLTGDAPVQEKLMSYVAAYVEVYKNMDNGIYLDLQQFYPEEWQRFQAFRQEKINGVLDILQEGMDKGIFRPINLLVLRQCLLASSEALLDRDFLQKSNLTYSDALDVLRDILLYGVEKQ